MANTAAKKNAQAWSLWIKIIAAITAFVTLLFMYFGVYGNNNLSMWSWIGYIIIVISYWLTISQVLNSIANGLPRPEMYWDGLITAWIVNVLMLFSGWFFWLSLWVPIIYIYKACNAWKQYAGMAGMGAQGQQNDTKQKRKRKKKKRRG